MNLKQLRLKKGLTQKELAERIGMDRSSITKLENGNVKLSVETAKAIGKVLKVKWVKFFED